MFYVSNSYYLTFSTIFTLTTVFYDSPSNVSCPANDVVKFNCSISKGEILWYVDDTYVLALPREWNASFKSISMRSDNSGDLEISGGFENSTLQFIAKTEANNSHIRCRIGFNNKITESKRVAMLKGKQKDIL